MPPRTEGGCLEVAVGAGTALEFRLAQPFDMDLLTQVASAP